MASVDGVSVQRRMSGPLIEIAAGRGSVVSVRAIADGRDQEQWACESLVGLGPSSAEPPACRSLDPSLPFADREDWPGRIPVQRRRR